MSRLPRIEFGHILYRVASRSSGRQRVSRDDDGRENMENTLTLINSSGPKRGGHHET